MIGPELQKAVYAALMAEPALCGGRVYDNPPDEAQRTATTGAAWPCITIGDAQVLDAGNSCEAGYEVFDDLHVWSRSDARSKLEAKALAAAAVDRLLALSSVAGFTVTGAKMETARTMRDPDGITEHGVVTMRYLLDPA